MNSLESEEGKQNDTLIIWAVIFSVIKFMCLIHTGYSDMISSQTEMRFEWLSKDLRCLFFSLSLQLTPHTVETETDKHSCSSVLPQVSN